MKNNETKLVNEMMVRMGLKDKTLVNESTISIGEILSFMESNDPNGDYDIEFIREQPESVANILQQWVDDLNGEDVPKINLMKSYIEFLGGNDNKPSVNPLLQLIEEIKKYDFSDIREEIVINGSEDNDNYFSPKEFEIELDGWYLSFELSATTSTEVERGDRFTEPYEETTIKRVNIYELSLFDEEGGKVKLSDEQYNSIKDFLENHI